MTVPGELSMPPEIWAWLVADHNGYNGWQYWEIDGSTQYRRADLVSARIATLESRVTELEAALSAIAPDGYGGSDIHDLACFFGARHGRDDNPTDEDYANAVIEAVRLDDAALPNTEIEP